MVLLTGCSKSSKAPQEILIGANAPLSGTFAVFGQGGIFGLQVAVEDINKQGGVYVKEFDKKIPLKLVVRDNESDPLKSQALEEELLLKDKVNFTTPPNQALPLQFPQALLADRYKIPRISGGMPLEPWLAARKEASPPWQYSWTYGFSIATPGPPGSGWDKPGYTVMDTWIAMLNEFGSQTNKKVGVFASDEPDGRGWYTLFPKALKDLGYNVIGIDKNLGLVPMETTDFSTIISQWKANNVEILWGNAPGPFFGAMWKQARAMGFKPKMVSIGRGAVYYLDVNAWGDDLPNGVGVEVNWSDAWQGSPGIGGTTPQSLSQRWQETSKQPVSEALWSYQLIQILVNSIERAGTLDPTKVNEAIGKTDMDTIAGRVKFDADHCSHSPLVYGQWMKVDNPHKWERKVIFSKLPNVPVNAKPLFPVPYK
jgi:ABC-type branched-subunit amino acid transport system substrate-binding protein